MKRLLTLLFVFIIPFCGYSQRYRDIDCGEKTYTHPSTGFEFPYMLGNLKRTSVFVEDSLRGTTGAKYAAGSAKVSIIAQFNGAPYEDRLLHECRKTQKSILLSHNMQGIGFKIDHIQYKSGQYNIHGMTSEYELRRNKFFFSIYECGRWLLKIEVSNGGNGFGLGEIEAQIRGSLKPERLISSKPSKGIYEIYIQKTAYRDSVMLGCIMGEAYSKIKWLNDNVDSVEVQACIPSMYLGYQIAGIEGALKFEEEHPNYSSTPATISFLNYLKSLKKESFLEEFFTDTTMGGVIIPDSEVLDMDGYHNWLKSHPINRDLFFTHVVIGNP